MAEPHHGQDPTVGGPRGGAWLFAIPMALWVIALSLLTACCVVLALLLDSRAGRWETPVLFGVGIFIVLFYGWAIYSTVHPLSVGRPRDLEDPADSTESCDGGPEGASAQ